MLCTISVAQLEILFANRIRRTALILCESMRAANVYVYVSMITMICKNSMQT